MKLIVGLGNPGDIYRDCRHNIGFSIIKALATAKRASLKKERGILSLSAKAKINNQVVVLAQPLTFMNLSGEAVSALVKRYKINLNDLLVVSDDLDLGLGRIKIRPSGSSGGHRGLNSVINSLKDNNFARLRVGIGRPRQKDIAAAEYVLSPFSRKEKGEVKRTLEKACQVCEVWLEDGITEAMNIFNKRSKGDE